jgi:hypothetical protein
VSIYKLRKSFITEQNDKNCSVSEKVMPNLKTDRRSQRTQRMLHEALMSLMQEMRYDEITVQNIIDRADVGRSTFYAHYRDKRIDASDAQHE